MSLAAHRFRPVKFWISNICCCFYQAGAEEKIKREIQNSKDWKAAKDICAVNHLFIQYLHECCQDFITLLFDYSNKKAIKTLFFYAQLLVLAKDVTKF